MIEVVTFQERDDSQRHALSGVMYYPIIQVIGVNDLLNISFGVFFIVNMPVANKSKPAITVDQFEYEGVVIFMEWTQNDSVCGKLHKRKRCWYNAS
jgi:hypothetical protein